MSRLESANSINTFNSCKRKYYYSYKVSLPRKDSISTITGKAVHDSLEQFFKIDISTINKDSYETELRQSLLNLYNNSWFKSLKSLQNLGIDKEVVIQFYGDSMFMLQNFFEDYLQSLKKELLKHDLITAFNRLKPKTEIYVSSVKHHVQGYIDAVLELDNDLYILDYKTSSRDEISEDYKLQLAIYALLYNEKFNKLPSKVGLHFLRHGTKKFLDVNEELLNLARKETEMIQVNTLSNDIKDYDKNPSPFCRWKTGSCSFYDVCFGVKTLDDFDKKD